MLCVVQPTKDRASGIECPIKKGDIVTWRATVYIYEMTCYTFQEFKADMFFQASCFVELPDLSDEALEEERVKQQHEKISSSILVKHCS